MSPRRLKRSAGVDELASRFLRRIDDGGGFAKARAVMAWRDVVGPEIEAHTHGFALRNHEMVVFVDSHSWATELQALSEDIRVRLNEALGEELVGSIRFTVSRQVGRKREEERVEAEGERFYAPDDIEPVPLTDVERGQIEYIAATVEDERLRAVAIRVMTRDQELKKGRRAKSGLGDDPPEGR